MTEREKEVLDLVILWRVARFAVEEALIRQRLIHAVDMLRKEREQAGKSGS